MSGELLLLHAPDACGIAAQDGAIEGGSKTMRKCTRYKNVYSPATGGMVRKCASFSGVSGGGLLGGLEGTPALGQASTLRGTFSDVKDVALTAAIGAGGAIITDMVFDQLTKNIESLAGLTSYKRALAEAATGIAIGIVVGKFLKRPKLGAKLAMGPVVLAALRIAGELLDQGPFSAGKLADIGMMSIEPYRPEMAVGSDGLGAMQVGPGTPGWMLTPEGQLAGSLSGSLPA